MAQKAELDFFALLRAQEIVEGSMWKDVSSVNEMSLWDLPRFTLFRSSETCTMTHVMMQWGPLRCAKSFTTHS